jgi:hypothetical protein
MIIIEHRRNSLEQIRQSLPRRGVEIDLRNHGQEILVTHDPFITEAITIEEWLKNYRHKFLIANVKEEGIEDRLTSLFQQQGIADFFILDESFPFIRKYALLGLSKFALRVSEFEDYRTAIKLADYLQQHGKKVDWIWVDTFTGEPLPLEQAEALRKAGYKLCFVSPELHHIPDPACWQERVEGFITKLNSMNTKAIWPDMVCSKLPELWEKAVS